jgi:hypothetical protein
MPPEEGKQITSEEKERRRKALEYADAHNRLAGIMPDPVTEPIFAAFLRGEIELEEMQPLISSALQITLGDVQHQDMNDVAE